MYHIQRDAYEHLHCVWCNRIHQFNNLFLLISITKTESTLFKLQRVCEIHQCN